MERRMAKVACSVVNGIAIRLSEPGYDDGTGKPARAAGGYVTIPGPSSLHTGVNNTAAYEPVISEVDADFIERWMEANQKNPMVTSGMLAVLQGDQNEAANAGPSTESPADVDPVEPQTEPVEPEPETQVEENEPDAVDPSVPVNAGDQPVNPTP